MPVGHSPKTSVSLPTTTTITTSTARSQVESTSSDPLPIRFTQPEITPSPWRVECKTPNSSSSSSNFLNIFSSTTTQSLVNPIMSVSTAQIAITTTALDINSHSHNVTTTTTNTLNSSSLPIFTNKELVKAAASATDASKGAIPKDKKVQTGIDRYVNISKRKLSPKSQKIAPTSKQSKKFSFPSKNTPKRSETSSNPMSDDRHNRFDILSDKNDDGVHETASAIITEHKPPPIYLRENNSNALVNTLSQTIGKGNFNVASVRRGLIYETKIQAYTEKNDRAVVKYFDDSKKNYYSYQLKSDKGLSVVIKGIESDVPIEEIKEGIEAEGYKVKSVFNIINRNKVPQPMFKVEIDFDPNSLSKNEPHPIYNLRYVLSRKITVEEPYKRRAPAQCTNCQEFNHTRRYCKLPPVCVICGEVHNSSECRKPKDDPSIKICSNCGGNHVASYRGCSVYIKLRDNLKKKRASAQNLESELTTHLPTNFSLNDMPGPSLNTASSQISIVPTIVDSFAQNKFSYSNALKNSKNSNTPSNGPNLEEMLKALTLAMNNFMVSMQGMMQQMIANQTALIQALSKST